MASRIHLAPFDADFAYGETLGERVAGPTFSSDLGKTAGATSPNEFHFFWRRHLQQDIIAPLRTERVITTNWTRIRAEIAAMEAAFAAPVAMKGISLQYDLTAVAEQFPEALFLHIRRDTFYNAQSLLEAREKFHGDARTWYSTRPPGADGLDEETPEVQVVGQVLLDNKAIGAGLAMIPHEQYISLSYEAFCNDTGTLWTALRERTHALGSSLPAVHEAPESFESANREREND